jgi:hypothetical protein
MGEPETFPPEREAEFINCSVLQFGTNSADFGVVPVTWQVDRTETVPTLDGVRIGPW